MSWFTKILGGATLVAGGAGLGWGLRTYTHNKEIESVKYGLYREVEGVRAFASEEVKNALGQLSYEILRITDINEVVNATSVMMYVLTTEPEKLESEVILELVRKLQN